MSVPVVTDRAWKQELWVIKQEPQVKGPVKVHPLRAHRKPKSPLCNPVLSPPQILWKLGFSEQWIPMPPFSHKHFLELFWWVQSLEGFWVIVRGEGSLGNSTLIADQTKPNPDISVSLASCPCPNTKQLYSSQVLLELLAGWPFR